MENMRNTIRVAEPKIGIMAIGLGAYWPQFPNMRENILEHHQRLITKFGNLGGENDNGNSGEDKLVLAGLIDTVEASKVAGQLFKQNDVDVVFCHLTTYSSSETLLPAIRELDVPIILLNVQSVMALNMEKVTTIKDWLGHGCTCAGLPEMTASLKRLGKRFDIITGYLEGDLVVDEEISKWYRTSIIGKTLRKKNIGLFGRPYPGMMDLNVDETHLFKKFGVHTYHLQWADVLTEAESATREEIQKRSVDIASTFEFPKNMTSSDFVLISEILCGFSRIADKYDLCAIPNHYEGTPPDRQGDLLAALNPALSMLMAEGIACPVEADMKTAIAMIILKGLGGSATLAELYSMDFNDDVCIIGHSGAGDPAISGTKPKLDVADVFHGKSGRGYVTQFYPQPGPVTLFSLTQDADGEYMMIAAEGECVEGPILNLGDTNCRVRFSCGLRSFVNTWSSYGPTHHGVIGLGHHIETLRSVSLMLDIPLNIVCR